MTTSVNPPHDLPEDILELPCYEPAGRTIPLTGEDLTRNLMLTGAIGSGKTSTLNEILAQLIAHKANQADRKIGLLIFDFKQDGTAERVREWARAAGREDDLQVLDAQSETRFELFHHFDSLADLEVTVEALLSATPIESSENIYWECARRKRLSTALGMLRLVSEGPIYTVEALQFLRNFIQAGQISNGRKLIVDQIESFKKLLERIPEGLPEQLINVIETIETDWDEWCGLDSRTRSNEQSTMTNLLNSLSSYAAFDYFGGTEKAVIDIEAIIESGRIVVVSAPAMQEPNFAAMLGRLVKSRFFAALHGRGLDYNQAGRMVGIIMDEYPMVATGGEGRFADVTQFQAMRSMRGFAIAATQGYEAIARKIGAPETFALLAQFDQHFFFQSKETAVAQFTETLWGQTVEMQWLPLPPRPTQENGMPTMPEMPAHAIDRQLKARVGLKQLSQLEPGQAWVWSHETRDSIEPFWLVERHDQSKAVVQSSEPARTPAEWEAQLRAKLMPATTSKAETPKLTKQSQAKDSRSTNRSQAKRPAKSPQPLPSQSQANLNWEHLMPTDFEASISTPNEKHKLTPETKTSSPAPKKGSPPSNG